MPDGRIYDGFGTLDGGLDMGLAPELLQPNQYSTGLNVSIRGGYARARSGLAQRILTFNDNRVQGHFNGSTFQGARAYTASDSTQNSIIVAAGGRLFRIYLHQNYLVSDISPKLAELVTADTLLPTAGSSVTIPVTSETPFSAGESLTISLGSFSVVSTGPDQIICTYNGGSSANPIPSGTAVTDANGNQIFALMLNLSSLLLVALWQGENYMFGACGPSSTFYFDGSSSTIAVQSLQQLPSAWMGVYAWGRNWLSGVDHRTYVASDLVGDPSGTPAKGFVDAILYMTENALLAGGGSFSIPSNFGDINAMTTLPQLDNSLGIGPVLIGCQNGIFSNQAPTDRTTWQNLTYPIQSVAYAGFGPVGPYNHVVSNSDWWFRSLDGIRQFMAARRDFMSGASTTPQSFEISPVLDADDQSLLLYGSAIEFDNRRLFTVNPSRNPTMGVIHKGIVSQNLDTISSLSGKEPPAWESLNTGLDTFSLVSINDGGTNRAFALALNPDGATIDLWELTGDNSQADDICIIGGPGTNLIPPSATYDNVAEYNLNPILQPNTRYKVIFSVNDDALSNAGGSPAVIFPVVPGQVSYFTTGPGPVGALIGNFANIPVTAIIQEDTPSLVYTHIQWRLDGRKCDFGDPTQLKKLITAELYLDEITNNVSVSIYFRPDDYPVWTLWETIPLCQQVSNCALIPAGNCPVLWQPSSEGYAARVMLPRPPEVPNTMANKPVDRFYRMQFKFEITGHARFKGFKAHAVSDQQDIEGSKPPAIATCNVATSCPDNFYAYNSYSGNAPPIGITGNPSQIDFVTQQPRYYPGQGWQFPNPTDGLWYTVTVAGNPAQVNISDTGFP